MDERTPLLHRGSISSASQAPSFGLRDPHTQFCLLAGIPPSNLPKDAKWPQPPKTSIYQRAKKREAAQNRTYVFTATLTQSLLLVQITLSAVLTALGAASSPGIYVAVLGALNTVIGGLLAYFKGRGQPSRARLYREELESCIHQIENSEIMWSGITRNMHGYDEIDIDDEVSVRSEIARLTRLFEKAVKNNTLNNPDFFQPGAVHDELGGLRARPALAAAAPDPAPVTDTPAATAAAATAPTAAPAAPKDDPDESPATKVQAPEPAAPVTPPATTKDDKPLDSADSSAGQNGSADKSEPAPVANTTAPAAESAAHVPAPVADDEEPASKAHTGA